MSKKQVEYFIDPVYGFVYFSFYGKKDERYLKKLLKHHYSFENKSNTVARTFYIPNFDSDFSDFNNISTFTGIWWGDLFFKKTLDQQIGIICHECYHLRERTLPNIGVSEDYGEYNEHFAYYMSFLTEHYSKLLYKDLSKFE